MEERYGWKVQLAESSSTAHRHAHHHLLLQHIASPQPPLAVHNTDDDADAKRERLSSRLGNLAH